MPNTLILTLSCPQRPGIVHAVTAVPVQARVQHRRAPAVRRPRLRVRCSSGPRSRRADGADAAALSSGRFARRWPTSSRWTGSSRTTSRQRVLVMVSTHGHCLNDLIFRWRTGGLPLDIVAVVSNHEDLRPMAEAAGMPFLHVPVTRDTKPRGRAAAAGARRRAPGRPRRPRPLHAGALRRAVPEAAAGAPSTSTTRSCPASRAPSPTTRRYDRGVKLVGATAHYVTAGPRRGPDHRAGGDPDRPRLDPRALATVGRDAEAVALARAVKWHSRATRAAQRAQHRRLSLKLHRPPLRVDRRGVAGPRRPVRRIVGPRLSGGIEVGTQAASAHQPRPDQSSERSQVTVSS